MLAMPEDELSSLFEILRLEGYLTRQGDRYRVTTRWDRAVVAYLRRKHLHEAPVGRRRVRGRWSIWSGGGSCSPSRPATYNAAVSP